MNRGAQQYAQALFSVEGTQARAAAARARELLASRGHLKLLPRVVAEYEKLALMAKRRELRKAPSPETERTRILLQLYRKLVASA